MAAELFTLYKLIILYMLDRVSFPITNAQISDFLLERDYTDFMTLQLALNELTETGMITSETVRNRTHLAITDEGRETLRYFESRISESIRSDIHSYFRENGFALKNELAVSADYQKSWNGEYAAHLVAKERGIPMIDITLSVPTRNLAETVCDNWQKKNQEVYQAITRVLF